MKFYKPEINKFINANLNTDLHSLLLKKSPFPEVTVQEIVQQIKGRKVAEKKFPFLLKEGIVFPPNLSLEQASSEATGNYKKSLVSGKTFADLTCGFGVDAWFLSKNFENAALVEQNFELSEIVKHNWQILGKEANFINSKLEDFLENAPNFDLIFLDPARRDEQKNKVFLLEDLSPNLLEIQDQLFKISEKILVKLSPLIDISYLISILKNISEIHIVALKNDVKEVLVLMDSSVQREDISIKCINLESDEERFEFYHSEEKKSVAEYAEPQKFIYLPNNSVLKSGAFHTVATRFGLQKLHPNTQIYTSAEFIGNFPGRILEMEIIEAKSIKKGDQFNIISKNYPLKPEEIRKKYKLKDGGGNYLIFTESQRGKIILKS